MKVVHIKTNVMFKTTSRSVELEIMDFEMQEYIYIYECMYVT